MSKQSSHLHLSVIIATMPNRALTQMSAVIAKIPISTNWGKFSSIQSWWVRENQLKYSWRERSTHSRKAQINHFSLRTAASFKVSAWPSSNFATSSAALANEEAAVTRAASVEESLQSVASVAASYPLVASIKTSRITQVVQSRVQYPQPTASAAHSAWQTKQFQTNNKDY